MSTPSYRGVSQNDLIRSIDNALELLETHSTGAACQAYIDGLRVIDGATGVSKLGAIAQAKTDVELVQALNASQATYLFMRGREVLEFHAVADTDKKGKSVMNDLMAWSALSGAMTLEYNNFDNEFDGYLATQYLRKVQSESHSMKNAFLSAATVFSNADIGESTSALLTIRKLGKKAKDNATDDEIAQAFQSLDIREKHLVKNALKQAAGVRFDWDAYKSPMGRFGLEIEDLTNGKLNWMDPSVKAMADKVLDVLDPFYELDEVNMTGVGPITHRSHQQPEPMGVIFGASARVAQVVANAFPEMRVLDGKGQQIKPISSVLSPPAETPKP